MDSIVAIKFCLYSILIFFLARILKKFIKHNLLVKLKIATGNREVISNLISYGIGFSLLIIVLQSLGVNVSSLIVIAGSLGVGIGFGLQELTRNFVSGLTILLERKIKLGDFIEFDQLEGYVSEISTRSTIITTRDGADVVVPNSQLVESRLTNWTYESCIGRIHIPIGVAYGSDPVLVTEVLLQSAYLETNVIQNPAPKAIFIGFGDSSLDFELWVWVNPIDEHHEIRSSLNYIIEYNLRLNNISIPFPQRDLWLRNPEALNQTPELINNSSSDIHHKVAKSLPISIKELIKQVPYFHNLNDLELRRLIEIGYRRILKESEILFHENETSDSFYIILSGSVEVYVAKLNKHLTNLGQGKFFGELSLMLGMPRTATVKARQNTILFCINQTNFQKILQKYPSLYEAIVNALGEHKNELKQRQKELRELGLIDQQEDNVNPLIWVQNRLKRIFNL